MSLAAATSRNTYTGDNTTDTYSYTFKIFSDSDLYIVERDTSDVETVHTLTTDYTVTGAGETAGGTIVLVAGNLGTGSVLSIRRKRSIIQETDIRNQGDFYPEGHEDEYDKQIMIDQQQQDELDRSVSLPESIVPAVFDPKLPTNIDDETQKVMTVNDAGTGWSLRSASALFALATGGFGESLAFTIADNNAVAADVTGMILDSATYVGGFVVIAWERSTSGGLLLLRMQYVNSAWVVKEVIENSDVANGLTFTITSAGQVQYTSDSSGAGTMTFRMLQI